MTLDQTSNTFFTSVFDATRDPLIENAELAEENDGEFQGTINLTPPNNDADSGAIREELYHLVTSETSNKVSTEKVP